MDILDDKMGVKLAKYFNRPKIIYTHAHKTTAESKSSWAEEAKLIIVFHVIFDKYTQALLTAFAVCSHTHEEKERKGEKWVSAYLIRE